MKKNSPVVMILMSVLAIFAGAMEAQAAQKSVKVSYNWEKSVIGFLDAKGIDSSFDNRKVIAADHGYPNYRGTYDENVGLLAKLHEADLKTPLEEQTSIVNFLKARGLDSSPKNRRELAKKFGVANYSRKGRITGRMNNELLRVLKEKMLAKVEPVEAAPPPPVIPPQEVASKKKEQTPSTAQTTTPAPKAAEVSADTEPPMPEDRETEEEAAKAASLLPKVITLDGKDLTVSQFKEVIDKSYEKWREEKTKSIGQALSDTPYGEAFLDAKLEKNRAIANAFVEDHRAIIGEETRKRLIEMKDVTLTWAEVNPWQGPLLPITPEMLAMLTPVEIPFINQLAWLKKEWVEEEQNRQRQLAAEAKARQEEARKKKEATTLEAQRQREAQIRVRALWALGLIGLGFLTLIVYMLRKRGRKTILLSPDPIPEPVEQERMVVRSFTPPPLNNEADRRMALVLLLKNGSDSLLDRLGPLSPDEQRYFDENIEKSPHKEKLKRLIVVHS